MKGKGGEREKVKRWEEGIRRKGPRSKKSRTISRMVLGGRVLRDRLGLTGKRGRDGGEKRGAGRGERGRG